MAKPFSSSRRIPPGLVAVGAAAAGAAALGALAVGRHLLRRALIRQLWAEPALRDGRGETPMLSFQPQTRGDGPGA